MVLSLESATGSSFIKDFVSQNTNNLNEIDAYAGPCLITHPLRSWTPILKGDAGDPVLGTTGASITGLYYRIFDQIWAWGEFRFGSSGASFGSGAYSVSLPFPVDSISISGLNPANIGEMPVLGSGVMWDASATNGQPFIVHLRPNATAVFSPRFGTAGSNFVTATSPVAFAAGDGITWSMKYKTVTT